MGKRGEVGGKERREERERDRGEGEERVREKCSVPDTSSLSSPGL